MFARTNAFSGFSVDDVPRARAFYTDVLGLPVSEVADKLRLHLGTGAEVLVYPKDDHRPAPFTVLNFPVADIDQAVRELAGRGVPAERFDSVDTDENGVYRGEGPPIAWFRDPAGNIFSVLQET